MEKLVSIIMPTYNSEDYVGESIRSVQQQTYENWELIIADDLSSDSTVKLVESFAENDSRIKLIKSDRNLGPAGARNIAIDAAQGEYIAFLDSDDIWYPQKLQKQISFMEENGYKFSYTSYEEINGIGKPIGVVVHAPKKADYKKMLYCGNPIGNSTVLYSAEKLGKFYVPEIRKRNDFALWLRIMHECDMAYGVNEVLTKYRKHSGTVSSTRRLELMKYHWMLYRNIENMSILKSVAAMVSLTVIKSFNAVFEGLQRLRNNKKINSAKS